MLGGGVVLRLFIGWENRRLAGGAEPLVNPAILRRGAGDMIIPFAG